MINAPLLHTVTIESRNTSGMGFRIFITRSKLAAKLQAVELAEKKRQALISMRNEQTEALLLQIQREIAQDVANNLPSPPLRLACVQVAKL